VDATIIAAPSSTKNAEGQRDPEMHQTNKGEQRHFGMKAHIGVDADSGLVHTVTTTAANEADVQQIADLLHGKEEHVYADSGYRGAPARVDRDDLQWHIAARPSDIAKLPEGRAKTRVRKEEHRKASVRAKVEHPFRVIKRQFGLVKVRFRGLQKNTAHLLTLFALDGTSSIDGDDGGGASACSVRAPKTAQIAPIDHTRTTLDDSARSQHANCDGFTLNQTFQVDTMKDSKKITRRRHSAELKAQVLSECAQPGTSVASVAMSYGINANIVHKWRRLAGAVPLPVASFVPVALPMPSGPAPVEIAWNCAEVQQA